MARPFTSDQTLYITSPNFSVQGYYTYFPSDAERSPESILRHRRRYRTNEDQPMLKQKADDPQVYWDKAEQEFHWTDVLEPLEQLGAISKAASGSQDIANIVINSDEPVPIVFLSDWHIGSWGTSHRKIAEMTRLLLDNNLRVALLGDFLQMSIKMRGVLEMSDNALTPAMQMRFLESWAEDMAHLILWSTWDNHCYVEGTEVLTRRGWLPFQDLTDVDEVAQFDTEQRISFARPIKRFTESYYGTIYTIEGRSHRQSVTAHHDIVLRGGIKVRASAIKNADALQGRIPLEGQQYTVGLNLTDDMIRLATWVVMDGTTLNSHTNKDRNHGDGKRVQFTLSKPEKIENLTALLNRMEIPFTVRDAGAGRLRKLPAKVIRIYGAWAKTICELVGVAREKRLPTEFAWMHPQQFDVFLETLTQTDGRKTASGAIWSSTNKANVDTVQTAAVLNGYRCHIREDKSVSKTLGESVRQPLYVVSISGIVPSTKNPPREKYSLTESHYIGNVYCVQTPQGTVITRFDGKVAFSGNSVEREEAAVGFSRYAEVFRKKSIYHSGIGHVDLMVGDSTYRIASSHRFSGNTPLNPLAGQKKYMRFEGIDRELAIAGDSHRPAVEAYCDGPLARLAINCGTLQQNSGYAKRFFSLYTHDWMPTVLFYPDKHLMIPFQSLEHYLAMKEAA